MKTGERQLHLDCIRILAILMVIFNHTGTDGFFRFAQTQNPVLYWLYLACTILCTAGVPLFLMVSGALLLPKEESIGTVYKKRVLRFVLVILLFSFVQYLYQVYAQGIGQFDFTYFLETVYASEIALPYWFLYTYLSFLLMLPLLRRLAAGMRRKEYQYLFILFAVYAGVLPIVTFLLFRRGIAVNLSLPLVVTTSIVYSLLGNACMQMPAETLTRPRLLLLALASCCCIAVCALMTRYKAAVTGVLSEGESQTFFACLHCVNAVAIFQLLRALFLRVQCGKRVAAAIRSMGSCSFGVYLLHIMLMDQLRPVLYFLQSRIYVFPACIVYVLAVFLCGYALTWLCKRVPGLNRLL